MIINKKFLLMAKMTVLTILFFSALYFENAQQQRLLVLVVVFFVFIANNIYKYFSNKQGKIYGVLFIIDLVLIYLLELNSRLLINYFLHSFYIIILLEASITLPIKNGITIGVITIIVSMIKFIYLVYYKFNLLNFSQMIFFLLINILIMVVALFGEYNKQEKEKKDLLYKELLDTHKKLKEYINEVQRLSVIEERNRIARDIHDNLGHNMTALIMQLQMADHYLQSDSLKSRELLVNSIRTAKDSLKGIREVVETLRGSTTSLSADKAFKVLTEDFSEKTGASIDLKIEGKVTDNQKTLNAMYHILQEGLTNAVRHGHASKIWVQVKYTDKSIAFRIKDNGKGTENIKEGYGMKGIRERVNALCGSVEFKSDNGFVVEGIIYLEELK
jgi:signal transduction histidine kinase